MNINIAMIGASGSGKTSFMSGLHHHFVHMRDVNDGFGLDPIQYQGGTDQFAAVAAFGQLASVVIDGEFPPGTVGSSSYKFRFFQGGAEICTFDWMDYRGGAIEEAFNSSNGGVPSDFEDVRLAIDKSHAVAVFIDALQLVEYARDIDARKFSGINVINSMMTSLGLVYRGGKPLTFLFILTKCDASVIHAGWQKNNFSDLIDRAKNLLKPSLDVANRNRWRCGIVVTGVAGFGQVETISINNPSSKRIGFRNEITGDPDPFNHNNALFYLLGSILADCCEADANRANALREEADRVLAERSKLRDVWNTLRGNVTSTQIVQAKLNEAADIRGALLRHEYKINMMFDKSLNTVRQLNRW